MNIEEIMEEILKDPQDPEWWKKFSHEAFKAEQCHVNIYQVVSTIYLAKIIRNSVNDLNEALKNSGEVANKHAAGIKKATWILAITTGGLVLATIGNIIAILYK